MSKAGSTVAPSMASQGNKRAPSTAPGDVPEASPATPEGSPASQGSTAPVGSLAGPGSLAGKSKAGTKAAPTGAASAGLTDAGSVASPSKAGSAVGSAAPTGAPGSMAGQSQSKAGGGDLASVAATGSKAPGTAASPSKAGSVAGQSQSKLDSSGKSDGLGPASAGGKTAAPDGGSGEEEREPSVAGSIGPSVSQRNSLADGGDNGPAETEAAAAGEPAAAAEHGEGKPGEGDAKPAKKAAAGRKRKKAAAAPAAAPAAGAADADDGRGQAYNKKGPDNCAAVQSMRTRVALPGAVQSSLAQAQRAADGRRSPPKQQPYGRHDPGVPKYLQNNIQRQDYGEPSNSDVSRNTPAEYKYCITCGLQMEDAPFCPVDGHRHTDVDRIRSPNTDDERQSKRYDNALVSPEYGNATTSRPGGGRKTSYAERPCSVVPTWVPIEVGAGSLSYASPHGRDASHSPSDRPAFIAATPSPFRTPASNASPHPHNRSPTRHSPIIRSNEPPPPTTPPIPLIPPTSVGNPSLYYDPMPAPRSPRLHRLPSRRRSDESEATSVPPYATTEDARPESLYDLASRSAPRQVYTPSQAEAAFDPTFDNVNWNRVRTFSDQYIAAHGKHSLLNDAYAGSHVRAPDQYGNLHPATLRSYRPDGTAVVHWQNQPGAATVPAHALTSPNGTALYPVAASKLARSISPPRPSPRSPHVAAILDKYSNGANRAGRAVL